jgi:hypothetical protein
MDILTKVELEELMQKEQQWCVSIYLPTHRSGVETRQDPIRFKNLLSEAEKNLLTLGISPLDLHNILEPANRLVQDSHFWQNQSDGLAIFLSATSLRSFRLPLNFEELVVVEDNFYIKPLLALFTGDGHFYILALSQNVVRLLSGTRYSVSEVEIGQVGGSLAETLLSDDHQENLQIHSSGSGGGMRGTIAATIHGQGGESDESAKNDLLRYFHIVDDGLTEFLKGDQVPLVLAGVEYLLPIYKEANSYPNLIETVIKGNPDLLRAEELHKSAWEILEPHFQKAKEEALAYYQQLAGQESDRAVNTLEMIIPAANNGRVETLFVTAGNQQYGVFNPSTNEIVLHEQKEPGDESLLDQAAVQTYLKGGIVYILAPDKMPGEKNAVAVLRY